MHFKLNNSFIGIYVILFILHNINIVFYSKVLSGGWFWLAGHQHHSVTTPQGKSNLLYTFHLFTTISWEHSALPLRESHQTTLKTYLWNARNIGSELICFYTLYYIKNYNSDKLSNSTAEKIKTVSSKIILCSILVRYFNQNTLPGPAERRKLWTNAASHRRAP